MTVNMIKENGLQEIIQQFPTVFEIDANLDRLGQKQFDAYLFKIP